MKELLGDRNTGLPLIYVWVIQKFGILQTKQRIRGKKFPPWNLASDGGYKHTPKNRAERQMLIFREVIQKQVPSTDTKTTAYLPAAIQPLLQGNMRYM